jgi:hypothetical protein
MAGFIDYGDWDEGRLTTKTRSTRRKKKKKRKENQIKKERKERRREKNDAIIICGNYNNNLVNNIWVFGNYAKIYYAKSDCGYSCL